MADTTVKVRFEGDSSGLEQASKKASQALNGVKTASGQSQQALINLGRVVQDAPYGFIGIANNINPLLESFQRLKAESGSTKNAIASLGSSLIGGGGLGLAVSIATSLLVVLGDKFFKSGKQAKESSEEVDAYSKSVQSAVADVTKEVAQVELLVNFIQKETTSRKERIAAIKQLQSIAPAYFAQLNEEKATVDQVSAAYKAFSQNIINSITARIREEQLKKIIEERLKLQDQEIKNWEETAVIAGTVVKARVFDLRTDQQKAANKNRLLQLLESEKKLVEEINQLKPPDLRIDQVHDPKAKKEKEEKILVRAQITRIDFPPDMLSHESDFAKGISKVIGRGIDFNSLPISEMAKKIIELKNVAAEAGAAILKSLGGAFESLFENILTGGQNAFKAFANALGAIIKRLIATAIAALAVSAILSTIPGFNASGVAKALGITSSFASVFKGLAGFREGGMIDAPASGRLAVLHGREAVVPFEKIGQFVNMVGGSQDKVVERYEIQGESLALVLERYQRRRGRFS